MGVQWVEQFVLWGLTHTHLNRAICMPQRPTSVPPMATRKPLGSDGGGWQHCNKPNPPMWVAPRMPHKGFVGDCTRRQNWQQRCGIGPKSTPKMDSLRVFASHKWYPLFHHNPNAQKLCRLQARSRRLTQDWHTSISQALHATTKLGARVQD